MSGREWGWEHRQGQGNGQERGYGQKPGQERGQGEGQERGYGEGRGQGKGYWTPAEAPTTSVAAPTQQLVGADAANLATVNLAAPAPGELLRFGPGVPVPAMTVDLTKAAAVWRGETQVVQGGGGGGVGGGNGGEDGARRRRRRRMISWLLPLGVLIAVLAILLWQRSGSALTVTDATVQAGSPRLACDGTADIIATMHTNGANGTIAFRWRRSDGTVSDTLRQQVSKGSGVVHVVLLWSFHGQGTMNATATLEVLSPSMLSASSTFVYSCG